MPREILSRFEPTPPQRAFLKICKGCGEEKWLNEFGKHRLGRDGLQPRCRVCRSVEGANWKRENRERILQVNAAYRDKNRESLRAYNRAWNKANRDKHEANTKKWRERHPLKYKAQKLRHRNMRRRAAGHAYATVQRIAARIEYYAGLCVYCRKPADTIDHRIPLSRGGTNFPANLVPACRSCNSRKRHLTEREFREEVMPVAP